MSEARDNNFETLLTRTLKQQKIIEQLEQQKAELLEFIKDIVNYEAERVLREREILLNKYK